MTSVLINPGKEMQAMLILVGLTVVLVTVSAGLCPGGKWTCATGMTCCELPSGQQGCCPYANATCCPDRVHCCPMGSVCDETGVGHCRQAVSESSHPTVGEFGHPNANNYASAVKSTQQDRVCCISVGNNVDCVPVAKHSFGARDCCSKEFVCSQYGVCDLGKSNYMGVSKKYFSAWMENSELVGVTNFDISAGVC